MNLLKVSSAVLGAVGMIGAILMFDPGDPGDPGDTGERHAFRLPVTETQRSFGPGAEDRNVRITPPLAESSPQVVSLYASPFGVLDCSRPGGDRAVEEACGLSPAAGVQRVEHAINAENERESGRFRETSDPQAATYFDSDQNLNRLQARTDMLRSVGSNLSLHSACDANPAAVVSASTDSLCDPARLRDVEMRSEAALMAANALSPTKDSEEALELWLMHGAARTLQRYSSLLASPGADPAEIAASKAAFDGQLQKMREFASRRHSPGAEFESFISGLSGI